MPSIVFHVQKAFVDTNFLFAWPLQNCPTPLCNVGFYSWETNYSEFPPLQTHTPDGMFQVSMTFMSDAKISFLSRKAPGAHLCSSFSQLILAISVPFLRQGKKKYEKMNKQNKNTNIEKLHLKVKWLLWCSVFGEVLSTGCRCIWTSHSLHFQGRTQCSFSGQMVTDKTFNNIFKILMLHNTIFISISTELQSPK